MIKARICFSLAYFFFFLQAYGQDTLPSRSMEPVVIHAFGHEKPLQRVSSPVIMVGQRQLSRPGQPSVLQSVNTRPGIRMEERSPGSYRFSIRSSNLRAPFGVRNIKVYFNNIPITDPGGQTYLNQLGPHNFKSLEIIKGPAGSLYGAGTGGVIIIDGSDKDTMHNLVAGYVGGSYGMHNGHIQYALRAGKSTQQFTFQQQKAAGYRDHSSLDRKVLTWISATDASQRSSWQTSFLYGDLAYETPGALTEAEYNLNPRGARPGNASFPGAVEAKAGIRQQQFLTGISNVLKWSSATRHTLTLYGMFTHLRNPAIQNYGENFEPHTGGRVVISHDLSLEKGILNLDIGLEAQKGIGTIKAYTNKEGNADSMLYTDRIRNFQLLVFGQASYETKQWSVSLGGSMNKYKIQYQRFVPASTGTFDIDPGIQFCPRLAVMRKGKVNIYSSVSKGFSPPTTAEFFPSGSAAYPSLAPETGLNYDIGLKTTIWKSLSLDMNAFIFRLKNTIVQRRTAGGGDYYINAGKTDQKGIETAINYIIPASFQMAGSALWLSHTWHEFQYRNFVQLSTDHSGNRLPGEARHVVSMGADLRIISWFEVLLTYHYSDAVPLNDANTVYADPYHLLGAGLKFKIQKAMREFSILAGSDNIFGARYSLGNDLNAFGGRYYNPAAPRTIYIGFSFKW